MLLIVSNKEDLTTDYLILRLRERQIPFIRLNTEEFFKSIDVKISLANNDFNFVISLPEKRLRINKSDITGVYFRRPFPPNLGNSVDENDLEFVTDESLETMRSLWRMIDDNLWLNHPKYIKAANNKIEQLKNAAEIGLTIPDTLVSTDVHSIRAFYEKHNGRIIGKAVKHGFYRQGNSVKVALTQKIEQEYFTHFDKYAKSPMIFQEMVDKKFDLRVTVIGRKIFPTAILSQVFEKTSVDWRYSNLEKSLDLKHSKYETPFIINQRILQLMKHFHLNFSAMDFILDKNDNLYFLEMNPNGQWAWIEEKAEYPIRDAIISFFQGEHS